MTPVAQLVADVEGARARVLEEVSDLTADHASWRPSDDAWCISDVIEHLVLAERLGVAKVWQAASAGGRSGQPHENFGLSIEEVIERTWEPREQAPPDATPTGVAPFAHHVACFRACQPVLGELAHALDGLDLSAVVFPHFLCGPLDARQRLEFLRFHIDRHNEPIGRLKAQLG